MGKMQDMAGKPLITTIIPTFQRSQLLGRAIRSVLNQTYPDFRILVCDNASGDDTSDVVARLGQGDPRVEYHCHSHNIGGTKNFNYGLDRAKTPFFSFLSDDDVLLPRFYETAMAGFARYPQAAFSATEVVYVDARGRRTGSSNPNWRPGCYVPPDGLLAMFRNGHPPTWTGVLFRSDVKRDVGLLDERVGGAFDYDYLQRSAAHFSYVVTKTPGALFVIHESSWGHSSTLDYVWPGWLTMIRNITEDDGVPQYARIEAERYLRAELARKVFYYGRQSVKVRDYAQAFRAADILRRECQSRLAAWVLWAGARASDRIPGFQKALVGLNALRQLLLRRGAAEHGGEVEDYSRYLKQ